jgi:hypothetical protein
VLAGVAILLELAAGVGLAYVAGWSQVRAVLGDFDGIWLIALVGALLVSFVGYHYAYRGIFRVEGGPAVPRRQMRAVVAAGFGGFLRRPVPRPLRLAGEARHLPGLDPDYPGAVRAPAAMGVRVVRHGAVLGGGRVRHLGGAG